MAKIFTGKVLAAKSQNTLTVSVERKIRHPMYRKVIVKRKKYKVHFENEAPAVGEMVEIKETRPISKDKHFVLVNPHTKNTGVKGKNTK